MQLKDFWRRILRIVRSRLPSDAQADPLAAFDTYMSEVQKKLNNLALLKARAEAHEALIRSDLQVIMIKLDKLAESAAARLEGSGDGLAGLKKEYQEQALGLGGKLAACEENRKLFEGRYQNFRAAARSILEQGEDLKRRYFLADAAQTAYSSKGGPGEGGALFGKLLATVHDLEAQAEAAFELLPPEIHFEAELQRSRKTET